MENLEQRSHDAATAYLERSYFEVAAEYYPTVHGVIPIVAIDDGTLVHVDVTVRETVEKPEPVTQEDIQKRALALLEYMADKAISMECRFDQVDLTVISENQALLRHHRAIGVPDDEQA